MESFICKTNNAEEIKHSGELSGPFKNQYEAFHLRPNLFLVIILHILCPPLCLLTHKLITYHTKTHTLTHTHTLPESRMTSRTHIQKLSENIYKHSLNTGLHESFYCDCFVRLMHFNVRIFPVYSNKKKFLKFLTHFDKVLLVPLCVCIYSTHYSDRAERK